MSDNPILSLIGPLGQAVTEIIKLPLSVLQEPDIQNQIKEIPEMVRLNANYFVQGLREGPTNIQELIKQLPKSVPQPNKTNEPVEDPISKFLKSLSQT